MTQSSFIRRASLDDVNDIYETIRDNPEEVLPRSYQNILAHFDRFYVYDDGRVKGVASWQLMPVFDIENPDICGGAPYHPGFHFRG